MNDYTFFEKMELRRKEKKAARGVGREMVALAVLIFGLTSTAQGGEALNCRGDVTSIQGEGLIARTYRFEVAASGDDEQQVLEKCKKVVGEKQARMFRKNPALNFRKLSEVNLECQKGGGKFTLKRSLAIP